MAPTSALFRFQHEPAAAVVSGANAAAPTTMAQVQPAKMDHAGAVGEARIARSDEQVEGDVAQANGLGDVSEKPAEGGFLTTSVSEKSEGGNDEVPRSWQERRIIRDDRADEVAPPEETDPNWCPIGQKEATLHCWLRHPLFFPNFDKCLAKLNC